MDQIDHNSSIDVQAQINRNLSFQCSLNYVDAFFQPNYDESSSVSNVEHEQDENQQISLPLVYKKRVRTKFSQEQLDILEATFQQHRYPSVDIVDELVEQLNLPTQKITIWFQNRRARLKKNQQKLDIQHSSEKEDQPQYDSGIHLEDETFHESPASPPANLLLQLLPPPSLPPVSFMTVPSPQQYVPNSPYPFYHPMWSNFGYSLPTPSFQPPMANITHISSHLMNSNSSAFLFQEVSNYQHQREFHGEL